MESTDAHWKRWGRFDPYRAVLFEEKYKRASLEKHVSSFFESGELYSESLLRKLKLLYPELSLDTAVDFGCGVARLTIPLARRFRKVIGVDISAEMLKEAANNCVKFGISNVEFVLSDDAVSRVSFGVQLVHSFITLQHIPVRRGLAIAKHLAARLAPGGVCALHVPIDTDVSAMKRVAYVSKHAFPATRCIWNLLQNKAIEEPLMQINPYSIRNLYDALDSAGLKDIWLFPEPGAHYTVTCFGRKC